MSVENRSDCVETVKQLKNPIAMAAGNQTPTVVAIDSLLDNRMYEAHFKAALKEQMMKVRPKMIDLTIAKAVDTDIEAL